MPAGPVNKPQRIPPARLGGVAVTTVKDYKDGTTLDVRTSRREKNIDLPSSNVLQFLLESGSIVSARPSGTEPKFKYYCEAIEPVAAAEGPESARSRARSRLDAVTDDLAGLAQPSL